MGRASIKSNDPIPLVHDGPLYYYYHYCLKKKQEHQLQQENSPKQQQEEGNQDGIIIQTAIECLVVPPTNSQTLATAAATNVNVLQIINLIRTLRDAKTIKEQLQALQTYRSKSIQQQQQQQQRKQQQTQQDQQPVAEGKEEEEPEETSLFHYRYVLFRILLEWFLSIRTPMPLRRAIQANLDGIITNKTASSTATSTTETTTINRIIRQVLNSIVVIVDESQPPPMIASTSTTTTTSSSRWNQPLHSLHEALNYKVTHDILLLPNNNDNNNDEYVQRILHFLQNYAIRNLQPILFGDDDDNDNDDNDGEALAKTAASSTDNNNGGDDDDDDDPNNMFFVEEKINIAIQQSIQWAGILKTILADAPSMAIVPTTIPTTTPSSLPKQEEQGETRRRRPVVDDLILAYFETFLWQLMTCRFIPIDSLSNLGMAYSRIVLLRNPPVLLGSLQQDHHHHQQQQQDDSSTPDDVGSLAKHISNLQQHQQQQQNVSSNNDTITKKKSKRSNNNNNNKLTDLTAIAIVQGLAATAPITVMLQESRCLLQYFQQRSNEADPGVRLAALKGIHTLISRCLTRITATTTPAAEAQATNATAAAAAAAAAYDQNKNKMNDDEELRVIQSITEATLEIVLQAWENPPNRRLGNAIPSLFQKLVSLMQHQQHQQQQQTLTISLGGEKQQQQQQQQGEGTTVTNTTTNNNTFQELVMRLLAQPSNRKGRYRALETLLPIIGAKRMITLEGGLKLITSLLEGIGDRNSHSAGTIADLWEKILTDLLQDRLLEEEEEVVVVAVPVVVEASSGGAAESNCSGNNNNSSKKSKKKTKGHKQFAPELFQKVLPKWCEIWVPSLASALLSSTPSRRKHVAGFCLPRIASMVGGRKRRQEASCTFACLLNAIHSIATASGGSSSSTNINSSDHLGGMRDRELWSTLEVVRHSHLEKLVDMSPECLELVAVIKKLVSLDKLRAALRHFSSNIRLVAFQTIQPIVTTYASEGKDGLAIVEQEIALWEEAFPYAISTDAKEYKAAMLQCLTVFIDRISSVESTLAAHPGKEKDVNSADSMPELPLLHSFVVDFLIFDVVVRRAGYPSSIYEKEAFAIDLLGCIVEYASRDSRFVSRNVAVYERKRRPSESEAADKMLKTMLSREGLSALFCLLHSTWDGTRSSSFRLLSRLIMVAQAKGLGLAPEYTAETLRAGMMARGVYLASSPRQRESDTGARIIAFLNFSLVDDEVKWTHIKSLVDLLENRLKTMKDMLGALMSGELDPLSSDGGTRLPLAHGLIHSLQLLVDHMGHASHFSGDNDVARQEVCERMAQIFCLAIQVSLAVVADIKHGEAIDGMDEDLMTATSLDSKKEEVKATPLNVNTGAIGANGTFSSINPTEAEEHQKRIAIQRIVMGSWLLTRETCAALATLLTSQLFSKSHTLLDKAGSLLISTLISLKHAGAAFAAHRALQQISEFCFTSKDPLVGNLPASWANRLLEEISASERVKDSTLRRSTGYALGFLAIMRSEVSSKVDPRSLCPYILKQILRLSLPRVDEIRKYMEELKLSETYCKSAILQLVGENTGTQYEMRSRVHALNIIRLIVMDAPLANEVTPIVGKAVVSAVIGYSDNAWTVRNSSTMVYAAVMLRSIDADKNAAVTDSTGNNATTVGELFKSYPLLPDFLTAVLNQGAGAMVQLDQVALSPIFPILLLLARVQSVANSGSESREMSEPFIPAVFKCLQNRHLSIRTAAARALSNLCSGPSGQTISSLTAMVNACHGLLVNAIKGNNWNSVHGALLGINELAGKFREAGDCLQQSGLLQYFRTKLSSELLARWPPLCVSMVFQILETFSPNSSGEGSRSQELEQSWYLAISHLCKAPERGAGSSDFATAAAVVVRGLLSSKVWDLELSYEEHKETLSKLTMLLNSEISDVRLYACKAFKKAIYDSVDGVLATDSVAREDRVVRILSNTSKLLHVLRMELKRYGGSHPPTLRRLSRIILECIEACNKLIRKTSIGLLTDDLMKEMTCIGECLIKRDLWLHDNKTTMTGNGIEILSFAIGWHLQQSTSVSSDGEIMHNIRELVDCLSELNNPTLPWRLRHSAATCTKHCRLLEGSGSMNETLKQPQHQVLENVLTLLQDPDPDVRCSAGRAAQEIRRQEQSAVAPYPAVSQFVLEEAFQYVYEPLQSNNLSSEDLDKYAKVLLEGIIRRCKGMESKLNMLRKELQHTESTADLDNLLNVGTERKIFEDEIANTYEEPALANQLAVHVLLQLKPSDKRIATFGDTANDLLALSESVLSHILSSVSTSRSADLLHEVSRSNLIFVEFHSVLVAAAAVVLVGGVDEKRAKQMRTLAGEAVAMASASSKVHPLIETSMEVVSKAEIGKQETSRSILQCLFLLPPRMTGCGALV